MKNLFIIMLMMLPLSSFAENYNERLINRIAGLHQTWGPDCASCGIRKEKLSRTCDFTIENQFDYAANPVLQRLLHVETPNKLIKDSCFEFAQLNMKGPFASCQPGQRESTAQKNAPCVTERYTKTVRKSFDLAFQCLQSYIDPDVEIAKSAMKDMFYMMAVESGLHINARSPTKAGGLGQLTGGAIEHMNNTEMKMVRNALLSSELSECSEVSAMMREPMKPQVSNSCDRIALDKGSPLKNIIYTIAVQKNNRRALLSKGMKLNVYRHSIFKKLSDKNVDKIARRLSIIAHNAGVAGTTWPLRHYLEHLAAKGVEVTGDESSAGSQYSINKFIAEFRPFMKNNPHPANAKRADPGEPVDYFRKIMEQKLNINRYAGGESCEIK